MKYKRVLPYVFFAILVGVFVLLNNSGFEFDFKQNIAPWSSPANNQAVFIKETAQVTRVIDGDTVKVLVNNKEETVRLIGIDSPEVVNDRKPVQCFGKEASDKAKEILNGKTIILESDPTQEERDEYKRFLRYILLEDGTNFNKFMISEGYAREYTYRNNPYKYQSEFVNVGDKARKENKGLWGSC